MGELIEALRLYGEKGHTTLFYTKEEIEKLERTRLFYGVVGEGRIKRLSKYYEDYPDIYIEKSLSRDVEIIEKTPYTYIVKVRDDAEVLTLKDLFWLARLDLYPIEEVKLLEWIRANLKLDIPSKSRIAGYDHFEDAVKIETVDGRTYFIHQDGSVSVIKPVTVNGVKFTLHAPLDREQTALTITRDLLETFFSGEKLYSHKENEIKWSTENKVEKLFVAVAIQSRLKVKGAIDYRVSDGIVSVSIGTTTSKYKVNAIHNILSEKHKLPRWSGLSLTGVVVETGETTIPKAQAIVRQALILLNRIEPIKPGSLENMIRDMKKALEEKKVPVLPDDMSSYDFVKLYFIARAEGGNIATYVKKAYGFDVKVNLASMSRAMRKYLRGEILALGSEKVLKEFDEMIKDSEEETGEVVLF